MEFQYRAGDERRSRSPPPPPSAPPAPPSSSASGSADAHGGGDGPAELVRNPAVMPRQPPPPPPPAVTAASADELRRQAEKARIRERILREETEHWELELEVRREIREKLLRFSWPALGCSAGASGPPPRIVSGNVSLPGAALEAPPKGNAPSASLAKRKSPDHVATSTVSAATSNKKQQTTLLTCRVCGISTNSEKAMQDHLDGKVHKRKATALQELPKPMTEPELEIGHEAGEEVLAPSGDYTSTKLTMLTNAGALNEVMQMDRYLLCEVCNVRTADRVTMMCHLEGSKHISKGHQNGQASSSKPPDEASKNGVKGMSMPEAGTSAVASADPERVLELYGVPHTVRQLQGFLLCELCNVQVPSINGMRLHLSGKKHKNKANISSDAFVNVSTGEAAKEQLMDTDTTVVACMADQVETPLAKSLEANVGDDSEIQETTVASTKEDVATMDNTKTLGKKVTTASASAAAAQDNNVYDPYSLTMEVDSVHHPLQRVNSFLVCPCCSVKAPSEIVMRSHLAGKKHKHKMTLAARVSKDTSVLATGADEVKGNSSKSMKANLEAESAPSPVAHVKNAAAMAPMEVDRPAEVKPDTCIEHAQDGEITRVQSRSSKSMHADEEAKSVPSFTGPQAKNAAFMAPMEVDGLEEVQPVTRIEPAEDGELTKQIDQGEHAPTVANGAVTTQVKESVKMDEAPGKPIKIQVEGKVFTVLQQENGRLACEPCGVHGCNKDGMIVHLYTRMHWEKANFAQKDKERKAASAAEVLDEDGKCGSTAGDGSGGALTTTVV